MDTKKLQSKRAKLSLTYLRVEVAGPETSDSLPILRDGL
jgi:hypothetical protein